MKDTKANQRKFPLDLHQWLCDLPSNWDFQAVADRYEISKASLLNLRSRLKAKQTKKVLRGMMK